MSLTVSQTSCIKNLSYFIERTKSKIEYVVQLYKDSSKNRFVFWFLINYEGKKMKNLRSLENSIYVAGIVV